MTRLLLWLALLLAAAPAAAHLTPNSEIRLDFGARRVEAEAIIPLAELSFALRRQLPDALGAVRDAEVRRYVTSRLSVPGWQVTPTAIDIVHEAGPPDLRARFTLTPPPRLAASTFATAR